MALYYDYDSKYIDRRHIKDKFCIEGRHIKDIYLSRLFESNPIDEVSKLMKSLSDYHDVTFNF